MNLFKHIFYFKIIKKNLKKRQKGVILLRRTHIDATWHARPCGRATPAHAGACVARRWRGGRADT